MNEAEPLATTIQQPDDDWDEDDSSNVIVWVLALITWAIGVCVGIGAHAIYIGRL